MQKKADVRVFRVVRVKVPETGSAADYSLQLSSLDATWDKDGYGGFGQLPKNCPFQLKTGKGGVQQPPRVEWVEIPFFESNGREILESSEARPCEPLTDASNASGVVAIFEATEGDDGVYFYDKVCGFVWCATNLILQGAGLAILRMGQEIEFNWTVKGKPQGERRLRFIALLPQ